jgi:hypothetical protein
MGLALGCLSVMWMNSRKPTWRASPLPDSLEESPGCPQVLIRTTGRLLQRGKVFQQHSVEKVVAATHLS